MNSNQARKRTALRRGAIVFGVVAVAAVIVVLFWRGPEWVDGINPDHLGKDDGPKATVVAGLRTALATCLVGIAALLGLYFSRATYQQNRAKDQEQFALARQQFELAQEIQQQSRAKDQEQSELAREGQITDRYIKAATLLADEGDNALTARLAGIYALERIMRDSEKDHETIVKLLAAFIRRHAKITDDDGEPVSTPAVDRDLHARVARSSGPERVFRGRGGSRRRACRFQRMLSAGVEGVSVPCLTRRTSRSA
jgi:hypothetical protein